MRVCFLLSCVDVWVGGALMMDVELGPCQIDSKFESYVNPHSWSEVSNLLFLSQPLGVGMGSLWRVEFRLTV